MKKSVIFTVGFDPKFIFKTILEQPDADLFIAVINNDKNEKVLKALDEITTFIKEYVERSVEVWEIDFSSPHEAFHEISKRLLDLEESSIIIDVSSGMRLIGIITLGAAIASVDPYRLQIRIWTEDLKGRYDISFLTYITVKPFLSSLSLRVLDLISRKEALTLDDISRELAKSKPTVFRSVKLLRQLGLITPEKRGRKDLYKLTPKGMVISRAFRNVLPSEGEKNHSDGVD
ncbi:MAG: hypothetical protein C0179_04750 [Fervidicoccus sp.]|nr:MAG: hypothetical protein C0179_04750 [Fervidicoccus sp.]